MIKKQIRKVYPLLFISLAFAIFGHVVGLKSSYYMKTIFDNVLSSERSMDFLKTNAVQMLLFLVASNIIMLTGLFFKAKYNKKAMTNVKGFYIKKLFTKKVNEFQSENTAKYFSNLTNDMQKVETKFVDAFYNAFNGIANTIITISVLLYVNYIMLLAALGVGIILGIAVVLTGIPIQKYELKISNIKEAYTGYVKEIISAFQIIKTNNLEKKADADFYNKSKRVEDQEFKLGKIIAYIVLIIGFIMGAIMLGIIIVGVYAISKNLLTVGTLVFSLHLFSQIINNFANIGMSIQDVVSVKKVFKKINDNITSADKNLESIEMNKFTEKIEFKNVAFSYDKTEVLQNVNLDFEKNKKYLITGPSGGGKTTLLKLLRKYFNPTGGEIIVDGNNLKEITPISYFKNIANIEQQIFLFEDSLYNNITLYNKYSDEELNNAIEKAGLTDFVKQLPDGLNYKITDNGKNISGGEKARIAIARGIISKTNLIFLDESFAGLDKDTAKKIERSLLDLKNLTLINVSHVVFDENKNSYDKIFVVKNKSVDLV